MSYIVKDRINGMALFAGAGGLELGLSLALGDTYRTVVCVEREAYAAATLVARMEDQALDQAPVWDDVTTFDGRPWRGVVDLISGGFPCQDISCAGNRAGIEGARSGLWFQYGRIIGEVGPGLVFVENVSALAIRGLDRVLGTLADLGFDAEWMPLAAGDVGATHERERIFILAHSTNDHGRRRECGEEKRTWTDGSGRWRSSGGSQVLAYPECCGLQDVPGLAPQGRESNPGNGRSEELGHAESRGRIQALCRGSEGVGPFPPGPADGEGWRQVLRADPTLEPAVCGVADGLAARVDRLRLCGNGVYPLVAAVAFRTLAGRLGIVR